jgi:transposase
MLRGEPLELVARETNVSIAKLSEWRERALAGTTTALKERERDDRDEEIARLKSKVGEITMDNELLCAKIEALEGKRPFLLAIYTIFELGPAGRLASGVEHRHPLDKANLFGHLAEECLDVPRHEVGLARLPTRSRRTRLALLELMHRMGVGHGFVCFFPYFSTNGRNLYCTRLPCFRVFR